MTEGTPHRLLNPGSLPPPRGFSHVAVPADGTTIYLAGQGGHRPDGSMAGDGVIGQFDQACANVATALSAAGARPEHLVSLQIFVTDLGGYRSALREIGEAYRRHFGRHYPAVSVFGVAGLFDAAATVELVGVAVVPDGRSGRGVSPGTAPGR